MSLGLNPGISVGIGLGGGQGEVLGGIEVIDGSGIGQGNGADYLGIRRALGVKMGS